MVEPTVVGSEDLTKLTMLATQKHCRYVKYLVFCMYNFNQFLIFPFFFDTVDDGEEEEVEKQPLNEGPLHSPPQVDKGKGIAVEVNDSERPHNIEASSFMALAKGYVAQQITSTRWLVEEGPKTFVGTFCPRWKG